MNDGRVSRRGLGGERLMASATLRANWLGMLVLAVAFGLVGGLVAAALTTARRIESSYDLLRTDVDAPDNLAYGFGFEGTDDDFREVIRADPAIVDTAVTSQIVPVLTTSDGSLVGASDVLCEQGTGSLTIVTGEWPRRGTPPVRVIGGRLPAAGSVSEIALPLVTAQRDRVRVGDNLLLEEACYADVPMTAPMRLTVVGIFVGFLDVRPAGQSLYAESAIVDPALLVASGASIESAGVLVWLQPGRLTADVDTSIPLVYDFVEHAAGIADHLGPDATALRLFAALSALAAVAVLGQLLARSLRAAASNHSALTALGATRSNLRIAGLMRGAAVALGAAVVAWISTCVMTPFIPLGAADYPLTGTEVGVPWLAASSAAFATLLAVLALTAVPAASAARVHLRQPASRSWVSRLASGRQLGTIPELGLRVALEPGSGPQPVPVRSGLGAAIIAGVAVVGVVSFMGSLEHLRTTPRLVGWNWDVEVTVDDNFLEEGFPDETDSILAQHRDVLRWSLASIGRELSVGPGVTGELKTLAFATGPRAVRPVATQGRAPEGPDELLLTAVMADRLGVGIGGSVTVIVSDELTLAAGDLGVTTERADVALVAYELVGTGVVPVLDGQLDAGAALTLDGLQRLYPTPAVADVVAVLAAAEFEPLTEWLGHVPELADEVRAAGPTGAPAIVAAFTEDDLAPFFPLVSPDRLYVDFVEGVDVAHALEDLTRLGVISDITRVRGFENGRLATTEEVVLLDLESVDWLPTAFGIVMALTLVAVLAHLIATGARARRRDLATLRALGLSTRQVHAVIAWQAVTLALVTAAIAVPVGVVAGGFIWRRYADGLGVVAEAVVPWTGLLWVALVLVGVALLAAIVPARLASRRRPGVLLRSE